MAPIHAGWLHKKAFMNLGTTERLYFTLTENHLSYYASPPPSSPSSAPPPDARNHVPLGDIQSLNRASGGSSMTIVTWYRTYSLKAGTPAEIDAWMRHFSKILQGSAQVTDDYSSGGTMNPMKPSMSSNGLFAPGDQASAPWLIDDAWLDSEAPLNLTLTAAIPAVSPDLGDAGHHVHVRLADGSVFSVDECVLDGPPKEVACAGGNKLIAQLESLAKPPAGGAEGGGGGGWGSASVACIALAAASATMLLQSRVSFVTENYEPIALTLLVISLSVQLYLRMASPKEAKDEAGGRTAQLRLIATATAAEAASRRSRGLSYLDTAASPQKERRPASSGGLQALSEGGAPADGASDGCPDFTGTYKLNVGKSDDPTEMLIALGVPWIARKAISKASRSLYIEHDGDAWTETMVTPLLTKTVQMALDGTPTIEISPVDKSKVQSVSRVEGRCVVTTNTYEGDDGKTQKLSRRLEEGGNVYIVDNDMTVGSKIIHVTNRFEKVPDENSPGAKGK
ncbi:hypothetical protein TeGR_g9249 [Tetraparma gracilis]|uniref:PH domain-containing protein n=1 Tax=Tetraparma gracilis TaxID=2962635 RepID=A0ABQ6MNH0_9STRA|nr:hypothetical protein TeGR_g9249 [Tetraparma gracilis]